MFHAVFFSHHNIFIQKIEKNTEGVILGLPSCTQSREVVMAIWKPPSWGGRETSAVQRGELRRGVRHFLGWRIAKNGQQMVNQL